jgi:hypothetical protein
MDNPPVVEVVEDACVYASPIVNRHIRPSALERQASLMQI